MTDPVINDFAGPASGLPAHDAGGGKLGWAKAALVMVAKLVDDVWTAVPASPASPVPTWTPGGLLTVTGQVQTANNTTAYSIGDIVGAPIELVGVTRAAGEAIRLERARLRKTSAVTANAAFRVHLFRKLPVPANGDNGVFDNGSGVLALPDIEGYIGTIDVTMNYAATAGARGVGAPAVGSGITCETGAVADHLTSIWAVIEARAAYVKAANEIFYLTVEGARG